MRTSIVLLMILFSVANLKSYTISSLLNQLIEDGTYAVLSQIKYSFNSATAIKACEEVYNTNQCERVVLAYITKNEASFECLSVTATSKNKQKLENIIKKLKKNKKKK